MTQESRQTPRIAVVSPRSHRDERERQHVERAVEYIHEAARRGARIVAFPEGYPGPYSGPADYDPLPKLAQAARDGSIYVIASMVEPDPRYEDPNVYRLAMKLLGPSGEVEGTYYRVLPNPKQMCDWLMGGKSIAPGDEFPVFSTDVGTIGILICSEAWSPELPLTLALRGAEILFAPIGGAVRELADNWRVVLQARAFENNMYVATCQHLWGGEESLAMIVGPEGIEAQSPDAGVLVADADLHRLRWLRSQTQELVFPKPYRSIPGMLRHRRPELYGQIVAHQDDRYDFFHFERQDQPT